MKNEMFAAVCSNPECEHTCGIYSTKEQAEEALATVPWYSCYIDEFCSLFTVTQKYCPEMDGWFSPESLYMVGNADAKKIMHEWLRTKSGMKILLSLYKPVGGEVYLRVLDKNGREFTFWWPCPKTRKPKVARSNLK